MSETARLRATPQTYRCQPADAGAGIAPVAKVADMRAAAAQLAERFASQDLFERLATVRTLVAGRVAFTTSFGLEDQAIGHAIFSQALAVDTATLDTGRLFPETYEVWAETERRYGVRILAFTPRSESVEALLARGGVEGFRASVAARLECCAVRKVAPLARALAGHAAWITGIRADQSADRAHVVAASYDEERKLLKINPLFDWTREQTLAFIRTHGVPYNALHDRGFLSIGCAPCTRAVAPGEDERAGRWWWEQAEKKECGLHVRRAGGLLSTQTQQT
jgi:phosphoadenosine phosphosulfate reductase